MTRAGPPLTTFPQTFSIWATAWPGIGDDSLSLWEICYLLYNPFRWRSDICSWNHFSEAVAKFSSTQLVNTGRFPGDLTAWRSHFFPENTKASVLFADAYNTKISVTLYFPKFLLENQRHVEVAFYHQMMYPLLRFQSKLLSWKNHWLAAACVCMCVCVCVCTCVGTGWQVTPAHSGIGPLTLGHLGAHQNQVSLVSH